MFMDYSGFDHLIRGHQCVLPGCTSMFMDRLITVFSASHYCGTSPNNAAVVCISHMGMRNEIFKILPYFRRFNASFIESESKNSFVLPQQNKIGLAERSLSQNNPKLRFYEGSRAQSIATLPDNLESTFAKILPKSQTNHQVSFLLPKSLENSSKLPSFSQQPPQSLPSLDQSFKTHKRLSLPKPRVFVI